MVGRMLEDLTGRQPDRSASPDEIVAHGAALYAELIARQRGLKEGKTTFTLRDINSHSLGIVGFDKKTQQRLNSIIIPKNSTLPCAVTKRFVTAKDNQRSVSIQVLEGESEVPDACTRVGTSTIRDLPPNLPAGWSVIVRYEYDTNGQLRVVAKLKGHEAAVKADFLRNNSLSDDDLLLWGQKLKVQAAKMD
jgi:molecular chaperone DnaK